MILVLFFLIAAFTSKIRLEIKKIRISNIENDDLVKEFNLVVKLYVFYFIKTFQKNINKDDLKNVKKSNRINKLIKNHKNNGEFKNGYNTVKKLKPNFKNLDLSIDIGTEDEILTSFFVCAVSTIISIFFGRTIKKYDSNKYKYIVSPIYNKENLIKLEFLGIVEFKLVNIINIIFKFLIRGDNNDKRTSYRKINANSNEQYSANDRC